MLFSKLFIFIKNNKYSYIKLIFSLKYSLDNFIIIDFMHIGMYNITLY